MATVAFYTLRLVLTLKGYKVYAALISICEMIAYVSSIHLVLQHIDQLTGIAAYAVGYAAGILLGSWVEMRMALGYVAIRAIIALKPDVTACLLQQYNCTVTVWYGEGMHGDKCVMDIIVKRKQQQTVATVITSLDPHAFIAVLEVSAPYTHSNGHH